MLYQVNKGSLTQLRDLGEINTQDPNVLKSFITTVRSLLDPPLPFTLLSLTTINE